ncbi:Heparan-alpha-glucosaminide [Musa troglodytarum]|uniref:Heparan-alpha-glucosaminide n=1 Tax=Musa troglodytarum TaxID=320322 RepID=A0A9E7F5D8_9LILI|nr:Heparan-alpha-glucosaminide [Musa troglodytarum]
MGASGGSSSARFHGVDRFYSPPAVRKQIEQQQKQKLQQQQQSPTHRPARPKPRPAQPAAQPLVESRDAADNRAESDDSSSKPSVSSSPSSPSPVPSPPAGNLDRFLEFTTPVVPARYLPKTSVRGWRNCDAATVQSQPYFCLGDLWESFKEWSAYGAGVPLVLNGSDSVVQYYVPYLSAIQLYVDTSSATLRLRDRFPDTSSDSSCGSEVDQVQERITSLGTINHNVQGDFVGDSGDACTPATRPISVLASKFPDLKTYRSCDLLPLSWMSVAWYPIYRIPMGPTLRDLDACFLTFHSLSSPKRGRPQPKLMASVILVSGEERAPLLPSPSPPCAAVAEDDEIRPWPSDHHPFLPLPDGAAPLEPPATPSDPKQRLASLDVFRGLTVALMILVDDAGGAFPSINHAPWFGVTLADFVMPFFLFSVGVSVALVFKKTPNKMAATKKVILRTINLFLLGLVLQGGYFHGRNHLTYGVDIDRIRWLALSEVWLVSSILVDSPMSYVKKYYMEWIIAIVISATYVSLLLGLYVPNWQFEAPGSNSTLSNSYYGTKIETVQCRVRGSLGPPCNAVGLIDRLLLGQRHLYHNPVYKRTKECSVNSPDYGPLPPNSPAWCLAPFDPEGLLSSLMAAVTCFAGLHFGHLIVHFKSHTQRILLWSITSLILVLCAFVVQLSGMPFSKPLYTLSYMFLTAGASGFLFILIYYIVDVNQLKMTFILFQWMGMNALIVYILAASELFPAFIQGFYWRSPQNNLVNATESILQTIFHSKRWGTLAFVLLEIMFWCLAAGFLHMKGIFIKL